MVMDMFYAYVETKRKKRVHFHGFMLDVHRSKSRFSTAVLSARPAKPVSSPVNEHTSG
jgi:protein AFG1